jgi:hypothetical protein
MTINTQRPADTPAPTDSAGATPTPGEFPAGTEQAVYELRQRSHSGANWFIWIAVLSMVNTVISLSGGEWNFVVGLGLTQMIDGLAAGVAEQGVGAATIVALVLDLTVAGLFVVFGLLARKEMLWAFIAGAVIYVLDGLLFVFVGGWLSVGFHAFALYGIYKGFDATRRLKTLRAETAAGL